MQKIFLLFILSTIYMLSEGQKKEVTTLGAGCFWCVEAVYDQLNGVIAVESGYSGGHKENPTYKEVCAETTGHAEVCQITFNPDVISFGEILTVFWSIHNPTTLNRQGADIGMQYRSAIFYHSSEQEKVAKEQVKLINEQKLYSDPIVTEVTPYSSFFVAENYHKEYFENNPNQPYCRMVVGPKVEKFQKMFKDQLKAK
ncbi:peptide-methionine (S)-S-oxide reductase MsrA [Labilibacter sediminis]|nr:peptide-methionine (S)-S-oxide reductase MsrA [Labilibacter sediminis]